MGNNSYHDSDTILKSDIKSVRELNTQKLLVADYEFLMGIAGIVSASLIAYAILSG